MPDVVTTDIQRAPWLDCIADAQRLPFASGSAANIVMVDVLHHLEFPLAFLHEAARVLDWGGRLLMIEPAITWGSTLFYRLFHHEPVRTSVDVFAEGSPCPHRNPTIRTRLFPLFATRECARLHQLVPVLRIAQVEWFSLAAYPLSGGFKPWSLVTARFARRMLTIECKLEPALGRFMGFRMMLWVEKIDQPVRR